MKKLLTIIALLITFSTQAQIKISDYEGWGCDWHFLTSANEQPFIGTSAYDFAGTFQHIRDMNNFSVKTTFQLPTGGMKHSLQIWYTSSCTVEIWLHENNGNSKRIGTLPPIGNAVRAIIYYKSNDQWRIELRSGGGAGWKVFDFDDFALDWPVTSAPDISVQEPEHVQDKVVVDDLLGRRIK